MKLSCLELAKDWDLTNELIEIPALYQRHAVHHSNTHSSYMSTKHQNKKDHQKKRIFVLSLMLF